MSILTPKALGQAICGAIGVDPDAVARVDFAFTPGNVGIVKVEIWITEEMTGNLVKVLKRYRLEPLEPENASAA